MFRARSILQFAEFYPAGTDTAACEHEDVICSVSTEVLGPVSCVTTSLDSSTALFCAGHKPTNYKQWFHATAPYPIQYTNGYEPYLLISRRLMPLYDERFRGYGYDKVCKFDLISI